MHQDAQRHVPSAHEATSPGAGDQPRSNPPLTISQRRPAPLHVMLNMALLGGSSLIYSQARDKAFSVQPFDPDVEYCQEEVAKRLRRIPSGDGFSFEFCLRGCVVGHLKQEAVPLNLIHAGNYYHFLIEWLPSFTHLLEIEAVRDKSTIVSGILHPNMWEALTYLLGNASKPIFQLRNMQMVTCDKIVVAPPSSHATELLTGGISDYWYNAANIQRMRRRFEPLMAPRAKPDRKIYVRRASYIRHLTNALEVEQTAREAGYEIVEPQNLSFFEQVRLFSSASHIVGPTGAWAANLLFAHETARVDVFYSEMVRTRHSIWRGLGECVGVSVNDIYCPVTTTHERHPIHSDYRVPSEICRTLFRQNAWPPPPAPAPRKEEWQ